MISPLNHKEELFMKRIFKMGLAIMCVASLLVGCDTGRSNTKGEMVSGNDTKKVFEGATVIELSDDVITVDGAAISEDSESAVYKANDIISYLAGQGFTYGEGTEEDEHTQEEADAHAVVHITEPGTYAVSGKLSAGQVAIDLGEDAEEDPEAVVTLILNGVDITCEVAPGVIFYNVYEPCEADAQTATKDVDTSAAGANVLIADGTVNNVTGSYVARIYKSVELNEAGTEVVDSKKLHKYDAAFYSKMSMNINGDEAGTGVLNIKAENEGLDSELHLTLNGGNVNITSGNDGINTNEDEVSVTTINGGTLTIRVSGETGEGDGIDSNGWLVINGGTVLTEGCSFSMDAGIDSDMGIHINGGTVLATGNMLDRISESEQNFVVFSFATRQKGGNTYTLKNASGEAVAEVTPNNDFTDLIVSNDNLAVGTYTLWQGNTQLAASKGDMGDGFPGGMMGGFPGGMPDGEVPVMPEDGQKPQMPEGGQMPQMPEGMEPPESILPMPGFNFEDAEKLDPGMVMPEGGQKSQMPEGAIRPEMPEGMERPNGGRGEGGRGQNGQGGRGQGGMMNPAETSTDFEIVDGGNYFNFVDVATTK